MGSDAPSGTNDLSFGGSAHGGVCLHCREPILVGRFTVKAQPRPSTGAHADGSASERVAERVTTLADDARVRAYEIMGDRSRAVAILKRRLVAD